MEKALFGAGCFWGVEDFFRQVPGVSDAVSGYAGGTTENPTYQQVCDDDTYHAEVVEVTFDPAKVSYRTLVELFFRMHNPTQKNRQGPDFGTQYRSVIFTHGEEQARIAAEEKAKVEASGKWKQPIVTQIEPAPTFWKAEESHQRYFQKHGGSLPCRACAERFSRPAGRSLQLMPHLPACGDASARSPSQRSPQATATACRPTDCSSTGTLAPIFIFGVASHIR